MSIVKKAVGATIGPVSWTQLFLEQVEFVESMGEIFSNAEITDTMELHN